MDQHTCKLCGKARLPMQVFCGAACSQRWEAGARPRSGVSLGPNVSQEQHNARTSRHNQRVFERNLIIGIALILCGLLGAFGWAFR